MNATEPWLFVEPREAIEETTVVVRLTIRDDSEPPVKLLATDLITLKATIVEKVSRQIVAGWDDVDVLNANGGAFNGTRFELRIPAEDGLVISGNPKERHVVIFRWTYNSGDDEGYAEVEFPVRRRPEPVP